MSCRALVPILCLTALLAASAAQEPAAEAVLLSESFTDNARGWRVDDYSRLADGGYVIDARNEGGYYRWLDNPANLKDFTYSVLVQKRRGNNASPLFGLIFRVQDSWRNCYFLVVNGSGGYFFGKFRQGSPTILKQGVSEAIKTANGINKLTVRANGGMFGLAANDQPLANIVDDTFPGAGRVGLCVEAPALVWFDEVMVTTLAGPPDTPGGAAPSATLYRDDFSRNLGWAVDEYRTFSDGAYHLTNQGQSTSFLSWQPKTGELTDFVAELDVTVVKADPKALAGVLWRVQDGTHFYFFLTGADGRFYAGLSDGEGIRVLRKGKQMAIRPAGETNTLSVTAQGTQFRLGVNGAETCSFVDATLAKGSLGVYLEQPGDVAFDNLVVTAVGQDLPPVVGGPAEAGTWPVGSLLWHDALDANGQGYTWPADADHTFDQGGYCVQAPEQGSRTVVRQGAASPKDGVFQVNARPVRGNLQGSFGLVVRAGGDAADFTYLLMNAAGQYYVGRCRKNQFETLDSGPVTQLRGGDAGNELQITVSGGTMRYGINDRLLGTIPVDDQRAGVVGLHVENGVVACFRNLRAFALPKG